MRSALALLVVAVFAQCQSQERALRFTLPVRMWEGNGSSPVYYRDGLWLPEHGVICEMQLPPGVFPNAGMPWRIVARAGKATEVPSTNEPPRTTEVRLPSALADRLVVLARRGQEQSDEQIALAAALVAVGAVRSDPIEQEIHAVLNAQISPSH